MSNGNDDDIIKKETVINYYLELMKKGKITFLKGEEEHIQKIRDNLKALGKEKDFGKELEYAIEVWKSLFIAAMGHLDENVTKYEYENIFEYFDTFVNFEGLIFASDPYYRDHTLHSFWVYFLGEYLIKKEDFKKLFEEYHQDARCHKMRDIFLNIELNETNVYRYYDERINSLKKYDDSARCIIALTHDLGYPLVKIKKINKKISKILPFFSIETFEEFKFQYGNNKNIYVETFLDILSSPVYISTEEICYDDKQKEVLGKINEVSRTAFGSEDYKEALKVLKESFDKLGESKVDFQNSQRRSFYHFEDKQTFMRYARDFEHYEHGIMSAYLIIKNFEAFSSISPRSSKIGKIAESINPLNDVKLDILIAISNHTSKGYSISKLHGLSKWCDFLILVDEIEEFSRLTRAGKNRSFEEQLCKTKIKFTEDDYLKTEFIFENPIEGVDPKKFYKDKCNKLLKIFDVPNLEDYMRFKFIVKNGDEEVGKLTIKKNDK